MQFIWGDMGTIQYIWGVYGGTVYTVYMGYIWRPGICNLYGGILGVNVGYMWCTCGLYVGYMGCEYGLYGGYMRYIWGTGMSGTHFWGTQRTFIAPQLPSRTVPRLGGRYEECWDMKAQRDHIHHPIVWSDLR